MDSFNISKLMLKFQISELFLKKIKINSVNNINQFIPDINSFISNQKKTNNNLIKNLESINAVTQLLNMNKIDNKDKSLFLRKLLNLPPTLKEVLYNIQNPNKPLPGGTLNIGTFNQDLLQNQKVLSSLFE